MSNSHKLFPANDSPPYLVMSFGRHRHEDLVEPVDPVAARIDPEGGTVDQHLHVVGVVEGLQHVGVVVA